MRAGEQPLKGYAWSSYPSDLAAAGKRPGWYLGDRSFKGKLWERIGGLLENRKADSVNGEAVGAWSREDAERWIGSALAELGMDEEALRTTPKGTDEKDVMAWWLRGHTTLSRQ